MALQAVAQSIDDQVVASRSEDYLAPDATAQSPVNTGKSDQIVVTVKSMFRLAR